MIQKRNYGFGIVGAGTIAAVHATAIEEIENATLIGIHSRTIEKAAALADRFLCKAFQSLEDMLDDPQIDIICVCTPSGLHLEPALAAIKARRHCIIEKPLEITTERCDAIIRAAAEAKVVAGVIFQARFYGAEKKLKEAVDRGRFGDMTLGDAYTKWYRTHEYYHSGKWRGSRQYDGGGALMNQGIHAVDLLQWYMGPVVSVRAYSANVLHKEIEVEDTITAIIRFANGGLGTIESSTAVFPGSQRRVEIRGTKGSAVLEGDRLVEWNFSAGEPDDKHVLSQKEDRGLSGGASDPRDISFEGHRLQIEDFIRSVEKGTSPAVTAEEARKSVAIIEAIYRSAETGEEVKV